MWPGNMGLTPSPLHLPLQCRQGWPACSQMLLSQEEKFLQLVYGMFSLVMVVEKYRSPIPSPWNGNRD